MPSCTSVESIRGYPNPLLVPDDASLQRLREVFNRLDAVREQPER
jgi:hypothetical protein